MNEKNGPGSPLQALLLIPIFAAIYAIQSKENLEQVMAIIQLILNGELLAVNMEAGSSAAINGAPQILTAAAAIFVFAVLIIGIGAAFRRWSSGKKLVDSTVQKVEVNQSKGKAPLRRRSHKSVVKNGGFLE